MITNKKLKLILAIHYESYMNVTSTLTYHSRVFGIRLGTNIYMFITLIGHLIFAYGAYYNTFSVMAIGRFIFG